MPMLLILTVACLLSPGFGVVQQEPPAAGSAQAPASAPAETQQTEPAKSEPPTVEKQSSDSAPMKQPEKAPANKRANRHRPSKPAPKPAPEGEPRKVVVRQGGATEPTAQIVPGLSPQIADQQRQHAVELLASAEGNLKQLAGRSLDSRQQETVAQIHNYMDGAHSALKEGDTQRAHTLALKAHLLADDLVKH